MALLDNVRAVLQQWPEWKAISATPARVDALEKRIAELEARLQRCPGEACPQCGMPAMRAEGSPYLTQTAVLRSAGARDQKWKCQECSYEEVRTKSPLAK